MRVLFFHYREAKTGKPILANLKAAGHEVVDAAPDYPDFRPSVEIARPEAVVADCSTKPMNALEAVSYVLGLAAYRGSVAVLTNVPAALAHLAGVKVQGAHVVEPGEVVRAIQGRRA